MVYDQNSNRFDRPENSKYLLNGSKKIIVLPSSPNLFRPAGQKIIKNILIGEKNACLYRNRPHGGVRLFDWNPYS